MTINGTVCAFEPGQTILQVANANGIEIPQYCYHDGLSVVASCRICLAEIWAPNPRNDNKIEPFMGGKLMPTCQTQASDGMVVRADSPKSMANQKAVMEYLLINHPLDCPVCDQAGECFLQDYSYKYGRGVSRFEEQKVKQPKKDLGPHVYLYSDRCIMCTRCVRFTREVSGSAELMVEGRGNKEQIDVFPGVALDNELSGNVIDLCPVGALLDKDFLFAQRVWFLKSTPSIDGITASGDNIFIEHNEGKVYRVKPRENAAINKWWITDEVRYGWKHVHSEHRIEQPMRREFGVLVRSSFEHAILDAVEALQGAVRDGGRLAVVISPMLSCEEAYLLTTLAKAIDADAAVAMGPVPSAGDDRIYPPGAAEDDPKAFVVRGEKAPNARGVRRVVEAVTGSAPMSFDDFVSGSKSFGAVIMTGNYPSDWVTPAIEKSASGKTLVLIDTLESELVDRATVVLPGATWMEKAGSFENAGGVLQAFEQAIPAVGSARSEGQLALDMLTRIGAVEADTEGVDAYVVIDEQPGTVPTAREIHLGRTRIFNAANVRQEMAARNESLGVFVTEIAEPAVATRQEAAVEMVEL